MRVGTVARWQSEQGTTVETVLASDGWLEIRRTSRSDDASDNSLDVMYGQFFMGELEDFASIPDALMATFMSAERIADSENLLHQLKANLVTGTHGEKTAAIDTIWKNPQPGTSAPYRYADYDEKISVLPPEIVEVAFDPAESIEATVFLQERRYANGEVGTDKYWYSPEYHHLVRYGSDHGSRYTEERLVGFEHGVEAC